MIPRRNPGDIYICLTLAVIGTSLTISSQLVQACRGEVQALLSHDSLFRLVELRWSVQALPSHHSLFRLVELRYKLYHLITACSGL